MSESCVWVPAVTCCSLLLSVERCLGYDNIFQEACALYHFVLMHLLHSATDGRKAKRNRALMDQECAEAWEHALQGCRGCC